MKMNTGIDRLTTYATYDHSTLRPQSLATTALRLAAQTLPSWAYDSADQLPAALPSPRAPFQLYI